MNQDALIYHHCLSGGMRVSSPPPLFSLFLSTKSSECLRYTLFTLAKLQDENEVYTFVYGWFLKPVSTPCILFKECGR